MRWERCARLVAYMIFGPRSRASSTSLPFVSFLYCVQIRSPWETCGVAHWEGVQSRSDELEERGDQKPTCCPLSILQQVLAINVTQRDIIKNTFSGFQDSALRKAWKSLKRLMCVSFI